MEESDYMTMGAITSRFRENAGGFWKSYHWIVVIFALAILADAASTIHFMKREGPLAELNPMVRAASCLLGFVSGPLVGGLAKAAVAIVAAIYCRRFAGTLLLAGTMIYLAATWYNLYAVNLYLADVVTWLPW
jgi:hypothetical protein